MSIEVMKLALEALETEQALRHGYSYRAGVRIVSTADEAINALRSAITQAESEPWGAREALERIASWSEHPVMLGVDYGSNGVRDYYRKIARDALTHSAPGVPDGCVGVRRNVIESALQHVPYRGETWSALNSAMLAASPVQKGGE